MSRMRVALDLPNFAPLGTPDAVRRLAAAADAWDGLFVWDHLRPLGRATEVEDVWTLLRAAAEASERLLVGPMIAALGRVEPAYVAERALELEAVAGGRVIVGFGRGTLDDLRAAGEALSVKGMHERVEERAAVLRQRLREAGSRIPLWTSGFWPRTTGFAGARVADGVFPIALGGERGYGPPPPEEVPAVRGELGGDALVAFTGRTSRSGEVPLARYAEAGLDWWMEDLFEVSFEDALAVARSGPGPSVRSLHAAAKPGAGGFVVEVDDPRRDDVRALLEQHLSFAREVTPPEDVHALDLDGLLDPAVTFFSLRVDGELLGVGAIKQLDPDHVELKSMHTAKAARRRGVGRAIVDHLLAVAAARGVRRVSLETGVMEAFAPARSLYADAGFVPCGPFGDYEAGRSSAFMTRLLG